MCNRHRGFLPIQIVYRKNHISGSYSLPTLVNEDLGARVILNWSIPAGNLNRIYKQNTATYLVNTTGIDKVIYTENIRRKTRIYPK